MKPLEGMQLKVPRNQGGMKSMASFHVAHAIPVVVVNLVE